jgi:toxin ParE1/3/4
MNSVTILQEAETELWETVEFYENKCVGLGVKFEEAVKAAVESIGHSPSRWPLRKDGTRRYLLRRYPYLVITMNHENQVWVIAIAHCKRRPGYWTGRLGPTGTN